MRWIERLKQKPKAYRERVAFFVASGITGVVVCIWLVATVVEHDKGDTQKTVQESSQAPFSGLFRAAKDQVASARSAVEELQSELQEITASTSGSSESATSEPELESELSNLQNIVDARKSGEVTSVTEFATTTPDVATTTSEQAASTTSERTPAEPVKREPREVLIMTLPSASSSTQSE